MYVLFLGCDVGWYFIGCVGECFLCKNKNCDVFNGFCVKKCFDFNVLMENCIGEVW